MIKRTFLQLGLLATLAVAIPATTSAQPAGIAPPPTVVGTPQPGTLSTGTPQTILQQLEPALNTAFTVGVCSKFKTPETCNFLSGSTAYTHIPGSAAAGIAGYCYWANNKCELGQNFRCSSNQIKDAGQGAPCVGAPSVEWRKLACKMDRRLGWNNSAGKCEHPGVKECAAKSATHAWYGDVEGCQPKTCTVNGQTVNRRSDGWCPAVNGNATETNRIRARFLKGYFKNQLDAGAPFTLLNTSNDSYCGIHAMFGFNRGSISTVAPSSGQRMRVWLLPRSHTQRLWDGRVADGFNTGMLEKVGLEWVSSSNNIPRPFQYHSGSGSWQNLTDVNQMPPGTGYPFAYFAGRGSKEVGAWNVERMPGRWAQWKQVTSALSECATPPSTAISPSTHAGYRSP